MTPSWKVRIREGGKELAPLGACLTSYFYSPRHLPSPTARPWYRLNEDLPNVYYKSGLALWSSSHLLWWLFEWVALPECTSQAQNRYDSYLSLLLEGEIWRCVLRHSLIHYSQANGRRGEVARTTAADGGHSSRERLCGSKEAIWRGLGTPKRLWGISRSWKRWDREYARECSIWIAYNYSLSHFLFDQTLFLDWKWIRVHTILRVAPTWFQTSRSPCHAPHR